MSYLNITGASIARCCVVPSSHLPARVNQHVSIVRADSDAILPMFLCYLLTSRQYKGRLLSTGEKQGATRQALTKSLIQNFRITFPEDLAEQKRIVAILDEAFSAIAQAKAGAEKNLANARELFRSILAEALCDDGTDWSSRELQSLLLKGRKISYGIVKPGRPDPSGVRLIKSQQVRDDSMDLAADFRITKKLDEEYARTRLQGGEILLNLVGASIGRSAIAPDELRGANVSRAIAVIPVLHKLSSWIQYNLRGSVGQELIQSKTGGSAQPVLNLSEVKTLTIPFPPFVEQTTIVKKLDGLDAETQRLKSIYKQKLVNFDELKQSLLQKAFTGQLTSDSMSSNLAIEEVETGAA